MAESAKKWQRVGPFPTMAPGEPVAIHIGELDLVAVRTSKGLRVLDGICPHQGALLAEGELIDDELVCRNHRWCFSTETGERRGGPQCLQRYDHELRDGELWVRTNESSNGTTADQHQGLKSIDELPGPRELPLIGSAHKLSPQTLHAALEAWEREFGPMYTFHMGPKRLLAISDPAIISDVLKRRPEGFTRSVRIKPMFKEMGVDGVFSAEGAEWRPQRRLAVRALANKNLKRFYPTLHMIAERLQRRWDAMADREEVLDIQAELMRFTVDVTMLLAFDYDTNTLEKGEDVIQRHMELVFPELARRLSSMVPYWRYVRLPRDKRLDEANTAIRSFLAPIIEETREELAKDPELASHPRNFLEAMLSGVDQDGKPFPESLIYANAMTMLLAGEDTTANTLAWAIHLLLDNQDAVASLRRELDRSLGEESIPPTIDSCDALDYATAIANETMRVRPVAPIMFADAVAPTQIGDYYLEPSTTLVLLLRCAGLKEENVPEADLFRPERWLDPKSASEAQRKGMHLPFGSGPRICPGRALAMLEIRMVLATLFKNFELHRVGASQEVEEQFSFTMAPKGLQVRLTRRDQGSPSR